MAAMISALFAFLVIPASATCPTLQAQQNFNVTEWIRASWYIQKQQVNGYQQEDSLYCVVATYNETFRGTPRTVPFFGGQVLTVYNDCNVGKTNGPTSNNFSDPSFKPGFGAPLCGRLNNKEDPAKIVVAPCALPNVLAGNYWVVEAGPTPDNYEYGIIIAGQPTVENADGCTTPSTCTGPAQTGCGLWVVTRKTIATADQLSELDGILHKKGISTQDLKYIDHTGCKYEGYIIKENKRLGSDQRVVQV
jgi:hypothetical protein